VGERGGTSGPRSSRFGGHQPTRGAHGVEEPGESRSSATDRVLDGALLPRAEIARFEFLLSANGKRDAKRPNGALYLPRYNFDL